MPLPVVVVDVRPADCPPAEIMVLVRACSSSLLSGHCTTVLERHERPTAIATVTWLDAERSRARVAVEGVKPRFRARARELRFEEADAWIERWRAAGFTVATLAESGRSEQSAKVSRGIRLGSAALLGSGLESRWRVGGLARVAWSRNDAQPWFLEGAAWGATGSAPPIEAWWVGGSAAVGVQATVGSTRLELRLKGLLENLTASATWPTSSEQGTARRLLPGVGLGIGGSWPRRGWMGLYWSGEGWALSDATALDIAGQEAAKWPRVGLHTMFGLEFRP